MNHLSTPQLSERDALCDRLRDTYAALEAALDAYNAATSVHWPPIAEALSAYSRVVEEAKGWCEDIATTIQSEIEEHSDTWQEGDKGQAFAAWQAEWEQADLETIEMEAPEPLSLDVNDQSEVLDALPEAP